MKKILILMAVFTASLISQEVEFREIEKILAVDAEAGDRFSYSVAIDGNYAIVGASSEDEDENDANFVEDAGSAYIFELDVETGIWTQLQKIVASDRAEFDGFGSTVAISGNYAIVGAQREDEDENGVNNASDAGSAYLFELNDGDGTFTEIQKIVASDRASDDWFGHSVAISGNYAIVGAYTEDEDENGGANEPGAGSAYIFELNDGDGTFTEIQKIVASDRATNDYFGSSVDIDGNYAIVGAQREDEDENGVNNVNGAGSAYIFELNNGDGTFTEIQKIVSSDRAEFDAFGISVAIDGNYAIVGAYYEDEDENGANNASDAGSAYIFELNDGDGTFTEIQKIVASDRAGDDNFGISVAIDGNYAIVGASNEDEDENDVNFAEGAGSAYIFELNDGDGTFTEVQKLVASDRASFDSFGFSVAVSGTYLVIGARNEDEGGNNAGSAYIFAPIDTPAIYNFTAEATGSESATFYLDVADGGATTTYTFDYGEIDNKNEFSYSNTLAGNSATVNVGFEDDSNLAGNTQYYVRASATNSVTWTESEEISFWTLTDEPAAHSTLAQIGVKENTIELSFDVFSGITNANGYLIVRSSTAIGANDLPTDGQSYEIDDTFGDATVVAKITDNTATSHTFNNLSKEQSWQFAIVPYNVGDDEATTNYKTEDVPTVQGYTIPTLGEWGMIAFTLLMGIGGVWYARRS